MERASTPALHPALLPPGTVVGPWRVVAWAGRGVHGAVYRAVPVHDEHSSPVALKLALLPRDPRFAREVHLLSRSHHPSIPRLIASGDWLHPSGTRYPYLAMEWIDGAPLYDWALTSPPSSQQVLRHLAQLASALHSLHSQGCLHRDFKGDNVLVRRSDCRAILIDFGSGSYSGAPSLTPQILPPGTPVYRSPEAWLFSLRFSRVPHARYSAGPADDLYSLGVTAYRLVTGRYPELAEPFLDDTGTWQLGEAPPPAPHELNPRVSPPLSALSLRMLSLHPEQRGSAAELAQWLDLSDKQTTPRSTASIFAQPAQPLPAPPPEDVAAPSRADAPRGGSVEAPTCEPQVAAARLAEPPAPAASAPVKPSAKRAEPRVPEHHWRPRLTLAAAGLALIAWAWWVAPSVSGDKPPAVRAVAARADQADAGTAGLGEAATTASAVADPEPAGPQGLAEDTLPEPLPGQARPDSKGRCPHRGQIVLNKGCWVEMPVDRERCEALTFGGHMGHMFKNKCYVPAFHSGNPPTSSPANKP